MSTASPDRAAYSPLQRTPSKDASSSFTTFKDKMVRALSPNRAEALGEERGRRPSWGASMSFAEERGRQPGHIVSTGRGGAGNLVAHAVPDDIEPGAERGRELSPHPNGELVHSGRGGAGNIRPSSHSRTRAEMKQDAKEEVLQEKLIAESRGRQADSAFSTGRGGVGNISRSRSRSQARTPKDSVEKRREGSALGLGRSRTREPPHNSGRGGFGNITEERPSGDSDKESREDAYEANVLAKHRTNDSTHPHARATGKGGAGNIYQPGPNEEPDLNGLSLEEKQEREAHKKLQAEENRHWIPAGRGGAGNMHRASEHSPAGEERGRGANKGGGVLGNVLRSFSRAAGREKSSDGARD